MEPENLSSGAADEPDPHEPDVVLPHIAYFFVPLPEPSALADGYVVKFVEDAPPSWWQPDEIPPLHHVAGSLKFHRAEAPMPATHDVPVLFELASRVLPGNDPPPDKGDNTEPALGHELTVVEVAVGCDLTSAGDDPDLAGTDTVSDAFDRGLRYVREVQRSYYSARRRPFRLVTRETLPFAIPFGIRRVFDDDGAPAPFRCPLSLFFLNTNLPVAGPELDAAETSQLEAGLRHRAHQGVFSVYLDFQREATAALELQGALNASVVFAATACEVLLDDLLAHLLWEEGLRPEETTSYFEPWLTSRVKNHYHARLGGNWSVQKTGPIRSWSEGVASLRNRVVHAGYEPKLDEARAAVGTIRELQDFVSDRLAKRTAAYPRTALSMPGPDGLKRRQVWNKRLERLQDDPQEVNWLETFPRWRRAMQQSRPDSPLAVPPDTARTWVYLVTRSDGSHQWVVHDREAGLAARVERSTLLNVEKLEAGKAGTYLTGLLASRPPEDVSVHLNGVHPTVVPSGSWALEYRHVPLAGVMVNGQDLDPP